MTWGYSGHTKCGDIPQDCCETSGQTCSLNATQSLPLVRHPRPARLRRPAGPLRPHPYAALLNDGRPHRIEVSVAGVPAGQTGWSTPTNLLLWQDEAREVVTGALTRYERSDPAGHSRWTPAAPGGQHRLDTEDGHRLTVAGHLNTSHGRVATTVTRAVRGTCVHRWTDGENQDALTATWTDEESVTRGPATTRTDRTYARYRLYGSAAPGGCYDRTVATAQGTLTVDRRHC